eukprot:3823595-Rhodomonas_salina.4
MARICRERRPAMRHRHAHAARPGKDRTASVVGGDGASISGRQRISPWHGAARAHTQRKRRGPVTLSNAHTHDVHNFSNRDKDCERGRTEAGRRGDL